ncbi:MAG: type II 3-dehydroquinate dehydratase [Bacteroidetes bacterium]|nr:type II 3-dehydroquinate dehydratase [Bacteroidota bacterium]
MNIHIINGPNLNLLGKREPETYGSSSFEDFLIKLKAEFPAVTITYFQSNVEGELINNLHEYGFKGDGIIFNAGGYTHTSVALADAIAAIKTPVVEVHISNVFAREEFRHHSMIAGKCIGSISGFGLYSYSLAMMAIVQRVK